MIKIRIVATIMITPVHIRRTGIRAIIVGAYGCITNVVHVHVLAIVNINVHITPASVYVYIVIVDRIVTAVVVDRSVAAVIGVAPVGAVIGIGPVGASFVVCRLRCGRLFRRRSAGLGRLTCWLLSFRVPFLVLG